MGLMNNIFKSITSFLKNHVWCLVVYFSTITLFLWGADSDLSNRAGFAASIVSIVLAIVVIVFTIQESDRMQRIIEQFGQKVEKNQDDVRNLLNLGSGAISPQSANQALISNSDSPDVTQAIADEQVRMNILKYYTAKNMNFTNVADKINATIYSWGWPLNFNLFDGSKGFTFYGHFPMQEPKKVMFNVKQLMKNIGYTYNKIETLKDNPESFKQAKKILDNISIDVLVADGSPKDKMSKKTSGFQPANHNISVNFLYLSDIEADIEKEYDSIGEL